MTVEGVFKDHAFNGEITFSDGTTFNGGFKDDIENAGGKFTYPDGITMEADDIRNGRKKITLSDGRTFEMN